MYSMYVFTRRFSRSCPLPPTLFSPLPFLSILLSSLIVSSPLQEKVAKGNSLPPTAKHEWAPTCEDWTGGFSTESRRWKVKLGEGRRGGWHHATHHCLPLHLSPSLEKITKKRRKSILFSLLKKENSRPKDFKLGRRYLLSVINDKHTLLLNRKWKI